MTLNLAFRGYVNGIRKFEQHATFVIESLPDLNALLPRIAAEHMAFLGGPEPSMVEIEFLDEPDVSKRFFRIGSDRSRMRQPNAVDPAKGIDWTKTPWKG